MTDAGQNDRAAEVAAGQPRICIKINSGNERANGITFATDKERWLRYGLPSEIGHLLEVYRLGSISIEGATKASCSKCLDVDLQILIAHPIGKRLRINHSVKKLCVSGFVLQPFI